MNTWKRRSERDEEDKGNPSKGGPGATRTGVEEEVGQPETTGMRLMNFGMRAAPIAMTVIGHTPLVGSRFDTGGTRGRWTTPTIELRPAGVPFFFSRCPFARFPNWPPRGSRSSSGPPRRARREGGPATHPLFAYQRNKRQTARVAGNRITERGQSWTPILPVRAAPPAASDTPRPERGAVRRCCRGATGSSGPPALHPPFFSFSPRRAPPRPGARSRPAVRRAPGVVGGFL